MAIDERFAYDAFRPGQRELAQRIRAACFEGEVLIHVRAGREKLRVREVPSMEHQRIFGESKLNAMRDGLRILGMILRERVRIRAVGRLHSDPWQPPFVELKTTVELEAVAVDS